MSSFYRLVLLQPLFCPSPGLFGCVQCAFELGYIHFLGQLSQGRSRYSAQSNQVVAVEQRLGLQLDVTKLVNSLSQGN